MKQFNSINSSIQLTVGAGKEGSFDGFEDGSEDSAFVVFDFKVLADLTDFVAFVALTWFISNF